MKRLRWSPAVIQFWNRSRPARIPVCGAGFIETSLWSRAQRSRDQDRNCWATAERSVFRIGSDERPTSWPSVEGGERLARQANPEPGRSTGRQRFRRHRPATSHERPISTLKIPMRDKEASNGEDARYRWNIAFSAPVPTSELERMRPGVQEPTPLGLPALVLPDVGGGFYEPCVETAEGCV